MGKMSDKNREQFLSKTRYGFLTTLTKDGSPSSVPVWFDWDGNKVKIFTSKDSPKVKRIKHDSRITLLVSNHLDEVESWVAFDGNATIQSDDAIAEFLGKLAARYWDLSDPKQKSVLNSWQANPDQFCIIEWVPTRVRSYDE